MTIGRIVDQTGNIAPFICVGVHCRFITMCDVPSWFSMRSDPLYSCTLNPLWSGLWWRCCTNGLRAGNPTRSPCFRSYTSQRYPAIRRCKAVGRSPLRHLGGISWEDEVRTGFGRSLTNTRVCEHSFHVTPTHRFLWQARVAEWPPPVVIRPVIWFPERLCTSVTEYDFENKTKKYQVPILITRWCLYAPGGQPGHDW